ncbi:MAG: DNA-binding response regulator [Flammeovirgaceae bacterium]|nr:DNA-binding response regulator [Flammeovirgaceae bacterium]MBR07148.1 DNA-binding response regulator [Rickettsiales bacterium]HCX23074.1 DNA-binding response regulator [Cytophagales bacterium]|tara:strand:+ start:331 stop:1032 length:702 start_codon:yes stop_codon:yes gene_type:complete
MSKAKVLIVEDEPLIAYDISSILKRNDYEVVGMVDEAVDALDLIASNTVDIALLDVNIEGNTDGIQLAAQLHIPFIFLTSYYDQATLDRAKLTNPSGYVVKPFSEKDLIVNLEIALSRSKPQREEVVNRTPEKFFVRDGAEVVSIKSSEILYVEASDNYSFIYTEKGKFLISHTLKSIEDKLLPFGFRRIHRSYLINFEKVDSISEGFVFIGAHKVQIGKSFRKDFMESLPLL